jgi:hypothetical protein
MTSDQPATGSPIIGDLSLTTADGTILTADTDLRLAEKWAEHEHGPAGWAALTQPEQWATTADALDALRKAYGL